jgi:hypothetical protein
LKHKKTSILLISGGVIVLLVAAAGVVMTIYHTRHKEAPGLTMADFTTGECPRHEAGRVVDFYSAYMEAKRRYACEDARSALEVYASAEHFTIPDDFAADFYLDYSEAADRAGQFDLGTKLLEKRLQVIKRQQGADSMLALKAQNSMEARKAIQR